MFVQVSQTKAQLQVSSKKRWLWPLSPRAQVCGARHHVGVRDRSISGCWWGEGAKRLLWLNDDPFVPCHQTQQHSFHFLCSRAVNEVANDPPPQTPPPNSDPSDYRMLGGFHFFSIITLSRHLIYCGLFSQKDTLKVISVASLSNSSPSISRFTLC